MQFFLRLAGWLPLPVLHSIGWLAGWIMWFIPNSQKRTAVQQVAWCLPQLDTRAQRRLVRKSLIETAKAIVEAPAFWYGPFSRVSRWIHDEEIMAQLRERTSSSGGAAIFLTPHLGAWELTSFVGALIGPLTILYKPQTRADGKANELMNPGRARMDNIRLASTDAKGVRTLLNALKKHEMIGILPDHDPPEGSGVFAPFFGRPAHTMDLVGRLARRSGAPVIIFVAERLSWGRGFRFHLIDAPQGVDDPEQGPTILNEGLEQCIMRWPQQYWWGYKRFRRLPDGVQSPYMPKGK